MKETSREDLEERVAAQEVQAQEQPRVIKVGISNLSEFSNLVNKTIENLNEIKNFKFEITKVAK